MAQIQLGDRVTPDDLVELQHTYPCLECLSESQLWMVAFLAMNFLYNSLNQTDTTATDRLQQMGCQNCLSDTQVLRAVVAKLISTAADLGYSAQAGLEDASCVQCAEPKQVRVALASLLSGIIGVQIIT